jgi:tRNA C32,U32 (ribose-2'-O)-methylase TrmJ
MERLYAHLAVVLDEVGFKDRTTSGTRLMERIRRLFNRADLDQNEANIVRGILTAVQQKRRTAGTPHERREAADPAVHREPSRQDPPERP